MVPPTRDIGWAWPVVLVGSLLLATLPGVWLLTDQVYAGVAARRLGPHGVTVTAAVV